MLFLLKTTHYRLTVTHIMTLVARLARLFAVGRFFRYLLTMNEWMNLFAWQNNSQSSRWLTDAVGPTDSVKNWRNQQWIRHTMNSTHDKIVIVNLSHPNPMLSLSPELRTPTRTSDDLTSYRPTPKSPKTWLFVMTLCHFQTEKHIQKNLGMVLSRRPALRHQVGFCI